MAGFYNNRSVAASMVVAGVRKETSPRPDAINLVNGKRTDVDGATYNARSCPLFAAGGYLTEIIEFGSGITKVDHPLRRAPEGAFVALLLDQPSLLYVTPGDNDATFINVNNDSGLTCRARLWIF